jgi:hypothetical protein
MEAKSGNPTRWIITIIAKPSIAARPITLFGSDAGDARFPEYGTPPFTERHCGLPQ